MGLAGKNCKLYYNSATHASPTWVLIDRAVDVSISPFAKGEANVNSRASKWAKNIGTQIDAGISFGYRYKTGTDTVRDALIAAFLNGTPLEMAVMDGAIATTANRGLRAFMEIMEFPLDQPLADGVIVNVVAKVTYAEESSAVVDPDWYIIP